MRKTLMAAVAGLAVTACLTATAVSVTPIDVTTATSSGNGVNVNGATFNYAAPQPTGTGYIDPFLREQNTGGEVGVNTSIKAQVMNTVATVGTFTINDKDPLNYTHDLAISSLVPTADGNYMFALDANQVANAPISLIRFQIFVSSTAFPNTAAGAAALGAFINGTAGLAFDMNGGATKNYRVDISSQRGSGSGDMTVLVPGDKITGNNYLYLVAGFGLLGPASNPGFDSNDGFEEWTAVPGVGVPDGGSTLLLLGSAFASLGVFARGRKVASIA